MKKKKRRFFRFYSFACCVLSLSSDEDLAENCCCYFAGQQDKNTEVSVQDYNRAHLQIEIWSRGLFSIGNRGEGEVCVREANETKTPHFLIRFESGSKKLKLTTRISILLFKCCLSNENTNVLNKFVVKPWKSLTIIAVNGDSGKKLTLFESFWFLFTQIGSSINMRKRERI